MPTMLFFPEKRLEAIFAYDLELLLTLAKMHNNSTLM